MATNTYVALDKKTVTTAVASVEFTSVSSGYTDLVIVISGNSSSDDNNLLQFNSDTGTNYSGTFLYGNGSTASSARSTTDSKIQLGGFDGTNIGSSIINIMNYANTTTYKTVINRTNSGGYVQARVGLWRSTSAISSIKLYPSGSNWTVGSTFSLYGIQAWAPESSPKATGGYVTSDATYWYHTFPFSGTFTANQTLSCDYLVVAGGGAAAQGGGGGGGYLTGSGFSAASSTAYTVTVGAGGSGGTDYIRGTNGADSVFASITATGGGAGGKKGTSNQTGVSGGSGGGGGMNDNGDGTTYAGGSASPSGQGYAGGSGRHVTPTWLGGGGGGGAGSAGVSSAVTTAPNGGAGITSSMSGTSVGYAGGGGGSHSTSSYLGTATDGGGAATSTTTGTNGAVSRGGGGGAGVWNGSVGGNGGSGIVIVRYAK